MRISISRLAVLALSLLTSTHASAQNPEGIDTLALKSTFPEGIGFNAPLSMTDAGDAIITGSYWAGFWRAGPSGVTNITHTGKTPVGGTPLRWFGPSNFIANRAGQVVCYARETQGFGNGPEGLYLATSKGTMRIGVNGMAAPGGGNFDSISGSGAACINNEGTIVFVSQSVGTGAPGQGVYLARQVNNSIVVELVARADAAGLAPDGGSFKSFSGNGMTVISNTGLVLFGATTTAHTFTTNVYAWDSKATPRAPIVLVPDSSDTSAIAVNDAGTIALAKSSGQNLILTGTTAAMQPIIKAGDPAPGGGTYSSVSPPVLNESGQIAFRSTLSGGPGHGFYRWDSTNGVKAIALMGSAPGGGTFNLWFYATPLLSNNGLVSFMASTTSGWRIYMGDGNTLFPVVTVGDTLAGDTVTDVSQAPLWGVSSMPNYRVSSQGPINDLGQIVFQASLATNYNQGIFSFTPPSRWTGSSGAWDVADNWFAKLLPIAQRSVLITPSAIAKITGPTANTTIKRLEVGDGTTNTRLDLLPGVTLTAAKGGLVKVNGTLGGSGKFTGALTIEGTHDLDLVHGQIIGGSTTYASTSHVRMTILSDSATTTPVSTGTLNIIDEARLDVVLDAASGSTTDFSTVFWDDIHAWRIVNASSVKGTLTLGTVSTDSHGIAVTPSLGAFSLKHTSTAIDLVWTPYQTTPSVTTPPDQLVALGTRVDLATTGTGNALQYQWRKNNSPISNAKSAVLTFASVALANAGNYTVRASNAAGSIATSPATRLGIVNVNVPNAQIANGGMLQLIVSAAFPSGVIPTYEWRRGSTLITNGATISGGVVTGASSAQLTITKMSDNEEGLYTCTVTMGALSLATLPSDVKVVVKPTITINPVPPAIVSSAFTWQLIADEFPTGFSFGTLPSGLKASSTGLITGTPNTSGSFKIRVSAKNAAGTGASYEYTLVINALPDGTKGVHSGLIARDPSLNGSLGGCWTIDVSTTGSFTGTFKNGMISKPIGGRVSAPLTGHPTALITVSRSTPLPTLNLNLTIDGTGHVVTGTLTDGATTISADGRSHTWSGTQAATFATNYNSVLELPPGSANDLAQPMGAAWQQMKITPSGAASGSGRTADGASYTFSGSLWPDQSLPQFVLLYASHGSITGLPQITTGATMADHRVVGWVEQVKTGPSSSKDRTYRTGIPLLRRTVDGSSWVSPNVAAPIVLGLPDAVGNAHVTFTKGGIESAAQFAPTNYLTQTFRISKTNVATFATAITGNPCGIKMSITASTGFFTGSLTLTDIVATKSVSRPVSYAGIMIRHRGAGYGYFTLAGLSPSTTTSDIFGGTVSLTP